MTQGCNVAHHMNFPDVFSPIQELTSGCSFCQPGFSSWFSKSTGRTPAWPTSLLLYPPLKPSGMPRLLALSSCGSYSRPCSTLHPLERWEEQDTQKASCIISTVFHWSQYKQSDKVVAVLSVQERHMSRHIFYVALAGGRRWINATANNMLNKKKKTWLKIYC